MVAISVSQQERLLSRLQAVTIFISRPWKCTKIRSKDHILSISDLKLRKSLQATASNAKKNIDNQTLEITRRQIVQLKTVYLMTKNDIAANNFIPVMELQAANGGSDASVF